MLAFDFDQLEHPIDSFILESSWLFEGGTEIESGLAHFGHFTLLCGLSVGQGTETAVHVGDQCAHLVNCMNITI